MDNISAEEDCDKEKNPNHTNSSAAIRFDNTVTYMITHIKSQCINVVTPIQLILYKMATEMATEM